VKTFTRTTLGLAAAALALTGCESAADVGNRNLDKAAENFEVPRRITAVNGITDKVLFTVEGFCSLEKEDGSFHVTCKQPSGELERTTLHLSDNVTFVSTQIGGVKVDLFRSRVIFRPETIIPNFDLSTSVNPSVPR
jgi:hypothetical protein